MEKGRKFYIYCINPCRHINNIEDIIAKDRATLDYIMDSFETSSESVLEMDKKTSKILDKISALNTEKGRVVEIFGSLKSLITPKLSIIEAHLIEMDKIEGSMKNFVPTKLKVVDTTSYALNGLIHVSELLIKSWDDEVKSFEESFQDILNVVCKH